MYSLFLHDSKFQSDIYSHLDLSRALIELKFIKQGNNVLLPNSSFMSLITFLGCSPNISTTSFETKITIKIEPKLFAVGGDSIEKVSCPKCKTKIASPSALIEGFKRSPSWPSPCCHNVIPITEINWRKAAAFSQSFIQISNIFPKEAIPSDELLAYLKEFSGSSWTYFYSKSQNF